MNLFGKNNSISALAEREYSEVRLFGLLKEWGIISNYANFVTSKDGICYYTIEFKSGDDYSPIYTTYAKSIDLKNLSLSSEKEISQEIIRYILSHTSTNCKLAKMLEEGISFNLSQDQPYIQQCLYYCKKIPILNMGDVLPVPFRYEDSLSTSVRVLETDKGEKFLFWVYDGASSSRDLSVTPYFDSLMDKRESWKDFLSIFSDKKYSDEDIDCIISMTTV